MGRSGHAKLDGEGRPTCLVPPGRFVIPVFALALATCSDPLGPEELPCQSPPD